MRSKRKNYLKSNSMKQLTTITIAIFLFACNNSNSNKPELDSINGMSSEEFKQKWMDSAKPALEKEVDMVILKKDTSGMANAPIKIISYKIIKSDGGSYRNMFVSYKNVSSKKITAFRLNWYGQNAFGEPADMGNSLRNGFGGGFSETVLRPGGQNDSEWEILSRDAKKVVAVWPTEIVFSDGTKWTNKN